MIIMIAFLYTSIQLNTEYSATEAGSRCKRYLTYHLRLWKDRATISEAVREVRFDQAPLADDSLLVTGNDQLWGFGSQFLCSPAERARDLCSRDGDGIQELERLHSEELLKEFTGALNPTSQTKRIYVVHRPKNI